MSRVTVEMTTAMFEHHYLPAIRAHMHRELEPAIHRVAEEVIQKAMAEIVVDITQKHSVDQMMDHIILGVEFRWKRNDQPEGNPRFGQTP